MPVLQSYYSIHLKKSGIAYILNPFELNSTQFAKDAHVWSCQFAKYVAKMTRNDEIGLGVFQLTLCGSSGCKTLQGMSESFGHGWWSPQDLEAALRTSGSLGRILSRSIFEFAVLAEGFLRCMHWALKALQALHRRKLSTADTISYQLGHTVVGSLTTYKKPGQGCD